MTFGIRLKNSANVTTLTLDSRITRKVYSRDVSAGESGSVPLPYTIGAKCVAFAVKRIASNSKTEVEKVTPMVQLKDGVLSWQARGSNPAAATIMVIAYG